VRGGNRALLSAGYYIDLNQSAAEHYAADPEGNEPTTVASEQSKGILGGEATMWSEYVTPENVDSRIWPRTAAIAERLWSPRNITQDVPSMYARLAIISQKLDDYGLQHNSSYPAMLSRMTGEPDPLPLRVFGDVMQPPRQYARGELRRYDSFTPLNRVVDAIPPESDTARQFLDLVNRIVSGKPAQEDWEQAQEWLVLWRDNNAQLQPLLSRSELTQELIPVSTNLHHVSQIGLDAIGYLREHHNAPAEWRTQQLAFLKTSEQPQAVLLNMIAPAVEKLVQATMPATTASSGS
jgi:hexosaminidase